MSYLMQCYKMPIYGSASCFSSLIGTCVVRGLNVGYMSAIVLGKVSHAITHSLIHGLGGVTLIFSGRIKGSAASRSVAGVMGQVKAFCVGSFTRTVIDVSCSTSVTSLGTVGVKVGLVH